MSRNIGQSGDAVEAANLRQRVATLEQLVRGMPATTGAGLDALWASRVGTMQPLMHSTVPAGALLANGQSVSRTVYAKLFAKLGTFYGSGDGVTTFGLPDMRGRTFAGMDGMGSSLAGRLGVGYSFGIPSGTRDTLGAVGGSEAHLILEAESGQRGMRLNTESGIENSFLRHIVQGNQNNASNYGSQHLAHTSAASWGYYDYSGGGSHGMAHFHYFNLPSYNANSYHNNVQPTMLGYWILWTGERP